MQYMFTYIIILASQVALVVKNPPANEGDSRDSGLIPGSGRFPGEGNGNPAWEIPWTQEAGRLHSSGSQKSWTPLSNHILLYVNFFKLFLNLSLELSPDSPGNEIKMKQIPHI